MSGGNIARARTDEKGHRLIGQFPGNMKAQKLGTGSDYFQLDLTDLRWHGGKLGDLLSGSVHASPYNLLASHLVSRGVLPTASVRYCCNRSMKMIRFRSGSTQTTWIEKKGAIQHSSMKL